MTAEPPKLWSRFILGVTGYFRRRRNQVLARHFPSLAEFTVCDLGGSRHFWLSVPDEITPKRVEILNIDQAAIDEAGVGEGSIDTERFCVELYDGAHIERDDAFYDLLLSNSVIEHVPPDQREDLAREMRRVSERLFVQTPAKGFIVDPHFIMPLVHWVPRPIGLWMARVSPWRILSRSSLETTRRYFGGTRLLTKREVQRLFPDATIHVERVLGLPKSYVAIAGSST